MGHSQHRRSGVLLPLEASKLAGHIESIVTTTLGFGMMQGNGRRIFSKNFDSVVVHHAHWPVAVAL